MSTYTKYFGLLMAAAFAVFWSGQAKANVPTTSAEELYSESIYIQKSSAEVPGSLESNARMGAGEVQMTATSEPAAETVADLEPSDTVKKKKRR